MVLQSCLQADDAWVQSLKGNRRPPELQRIRNILDIEDGDELAR